MVRTRLVQQLDLKPTTVATAQEWKRSNAPSTWASPVLWTSLEVREWLLMVLESCVLVQMDRHELGGVVDVGVEGDAKGQAYLVMPNNRLASFGQKGLKNKRARTFFELLLISCSLSGSSSPLLS